VPMVCIDLDGGPESLRGMCSRRLLEVRAGCYVGSLSRRSIEQLWKAVELAEPKAALLIYPAKNELGIGMKQLGLHRYRVLDHYGIPLVAVNKVGAESQRE
jgi:CRISPR-associated protein Cas2